MARERERERVREQSFSKFESSLLNNLSLLMATTRMETSQATHWLTVGMDLNTRNIQHKVTLG